MRRRRPANLLAWSGALVSRIEPQGHNVESTAAAVSAVSTWLHGCVIQCIIRFKPLSDQTVNIISGRKFLNIALITKENPGGFALAGSLHACLDCIAMSP